MMNGMGLILIIKNTFVESTPNLKHYSVPNNPKCVLEQKSNLIQTS